MHVCSFYLSILNFNNNDLNCIRPCKTFGKSRKTYKFKMGSESVCWVGLVDIHGWSFSIFAIWDDNRFGDEKTEFN